MGLITKEQSFERDEDFGGGQVNQKCMYNSISDIITIETDDQRLCLPINEWSLIIDLIRNCMAVKGHSFKELPKESMLDSYVAISKANYKSKDGSIKEGVLIDGNWYAPRNDL